MRYRAWRHAAGLSRSKIAIRIVAGITRVARLARCARLAWIAVRLIALLKRVVRGVGVVAEDVAWQADRDVAALLAAFDRRVPACWTERVD